MDRDTFWENVVDIIKLVAKIVAVFIALQLFLILLGYDIKLPYVHSNLMAVILWMKKTFGMSGFGI